MDDDTFRDARLSEPNGHDPHTQVLLERLRMLEAKQRELHTEIHGPIGFPGGLKSEIALIKTSAEKTLELVNTIATGHWVLNTKLDKLLTRNEVPTWFWFTLSSAVLVVTSAVSCGYLHQVGLIFK